MTSELLKKPEQRWVRVASRQCASKSAAELGTAFWAFPRRKDAKRPISLKESSHFLSDRERSTLWACMWWHVLGHLDLLAYLLGDAHLFWEILSWRGALSAVLALQPASRWRKGSWSFLVSALLGLPEIRSIRTNCSSLANSALFLKEKSEGVLAKHQNSSILPASVLPWAVRSCMSGRETNTWNKELCWRIHGILSVTASVLHDVLLQIWEEEGNLPSCHSQQKASTSTKAIRVHRLYRQTLRPKPKEMSDSALHSTSHFGCCGRWVESTNSIQYHSAMMEPLVYNKYIYIHTLSKNMTKCNKNQIYVQLLCSFAEVIQVHVPVRARLFIPKLWHGSGYVDVMYLASFCHITFLTVGKGSGKCGT